MESHKVLNKSIGGAESGISPHSQVDLRAQESSPSLEGPKVHIILWAKHRWKHLKSIFNTS